MAIRDVKATRDIKDISLEKVPPQNIEAEISVLGSMLIEEEAIGQAVEVVKPSSFYKDAHKKIFQAIIDLYSLNKAVDLVTLTEELIKRNSLDELGGAAYLTVALSSQESYLVKMSPFNIRAKKETNVSLYGQ